jgi:predicted secreted hydrolase
MRRPDLSRRALVSGTLGSALASRLGSTHADATQPFEAADPARVLRFPRDHGAHPRFRTEWWYVTGWLDSDGPAIGFQLTFFRSRTGHDDRNPSRFAPKQLLLAHAALAIEGAPALRHDQRAARSGFGLAQASETDTDVSIGSDWRLVRGPDDRYGARIEARDFSLELVFAATHPPVLQGRGGYSRKGPLPGQASHYYSRPRLAVSGRVTLPEGGQARGAAGAATPSRGTGRGATTPVRGRAWLDHEWSTALLDDRAVGWDWVGLDFDDGTALMAFRIRTADGGESWRDARWIRGGATIDATARFTPLRHWRSARSGARWPVAMRLDVDGRRLELQPLLDDQELDTRASTGTIYWEGAVRVFEDGRAVGRGYLELTGYAGALRL